MSKGEVTALDMTAKRVIVVVQLIAALELSTRMSGVGVLAADAF